MTSPRWQQELLRQIGISAIIITVIVAPTGGEGWPIMVPLVSVVFGVMMYLGNRLRRSLPRNYFSVNMLLSATILLASLGISLAITFIVLQRIYNWIYPLRPSTLNVGNFLATPQFREVLLTAFIGAILITLVEQVSRKLGKGVLLNWILGRYFHPREEERIFMFLDLNNSTPLAELLGDMRFSSLVQDFLNDLTDPLIETRGEVSHYIGDAAVLTWKVKPGLDDANCIRFVQLFEATLAKRATHYRTRFDLVPNFKAAAHIGNVVATEVGQIKSEIVFHGDVLNTTARIEGLCNLLDSKFLISRALVDRLPESKFQYESLGMQTLKGKLESVEVYSVGWSADMSGAEKVRIAGSG